MSREANRAKFPPELVAAMDEVRESCPGAKVRWVRTADESLGAKPEDEPGTGWISGEVWEMAVRHGQALEQRNRGWK